VVINLEDINKLKLELQQLKYIHSKRVTKELRSRIIELQKKIEKLEENKNGQNI